MTGRTYRTQVNGQNFTYWADYIERGMFASDGETTKKIHGSGYISNDLTVRKAIASSFGLPTFRKNAKQ